MKHRSLENIPNNQGQDESPEMSPEDEKAIWDRTMEQGEFPPAPRAYHIGEVIKSGDESRNWELCPFCGWRYGEMHSELNEKLGVVITTYTCRNKGRHEWTLNHKTGIIGDPLQPSFEFPDDKTEKEK